MKQYQKTLVILIALTVIWVGLKFMSASAASPFTAYQEWIIDVAPWLSLMTFGSYCLAKIGMDLLMFNDYPQEIKRLETVRQFKYIFRKISVVSLILKFFNVQDIINARKDLANRGFKM